MQGSKLIKSRLAQFFKLLLGLFCRVFQVINIFYLITKSSVPWLNKITHTQPLQSSSITPAPTLIEFFQAKPDLGAIRPYVLWGIIQLKPVGTFPFPPAGIIKSSQLHKSYPAAPRLPFLGRIAFQLSFLTKNLLIFQMTQILSAFISLQILIIMSNTQQVKKLISLIQIFNFSSLIQNVIILKVQILINHMQNEMDIQFQVPEMDFNIEIEPLENQSLVMEDSKLIFPKVDLVIDKNGINQLSNPQNTLTKFKIISKNMKELQQIGRGSAGVVKKAIYIIDNKQMIVAIKSIQAEQKQKRDQLLNDLSSFLTGQMSEYLVTFYGCYYDQGLVKQVIEYMNMGSLRNLINLVSKKLLQIDEEILAQIVLRIVKGLHHIHKVKHQIHRDIKPENILINQDGAVKITDFGISKYIQNTFGQAKTFVGTTIYMSPERIQFQNTFDGKAKYNSKCDVWSLGLLIYELASGNKLPYTINKKQPIISVLMRIQNNNPPSLQNSGRSQELIDFLKKCLDKNPQKRWPVQELMKHQWLQKYGGKSDLGQFMKKAKTFM